MKRILVAGLLVALLVVVAPAMAGTLYVDDDGLCDGNAPCYLHPQDAVNVASPGDTILVYPGTYGSREAPHVPPHWGPNDWFAPALIIYKNDLTIQAVDPNPANMIIESTHNVWSNPVAVQWSTGGTWDGTNYIGAGVYPTGGTAPNAVTVIANGVKISGFTIISTYGGDISNPARNPNTAGVFIGGLYAGDGDRSGVSGTVIENCILRGHSGLRLWKAPDTTVSTCVIDNNIPLVSPDTPKGAGIMVWDGWCDNPLYPDGDGWCEGPNVGSSNFHVEDNTITSYLGVQGIAIGGYFVGQMDHSDLYIDGNAIESSGDGVTFWGSGGTSKVMTCNNIVNVPGGYSQVGVWWGTYDGPFGLDSDSNGIPDCVCMEPTIDSPLVKLGVNRWIWDGSDWVTELPKGKGPTVDFTVEQTGWCGCSQILDWLQANYPVEYPDVDGHRKFGCSISIVTDFIGLINAV